MLSLSDGDRRSLLCLARLAITEAVLRGQLLEQIPTDGIFTEKRGVFVSLHVGRRLRGCIGVAETDETLGDCIVRCAVTAARQDPRFPPLRHEELSNLQIEISVLSPPITIRPDEIQIGYHGLLICRGTQRGVLLPQVAMRHQLTAEQFLAETCRKAFLPLDAWRHPDANLFGFTCEIFSSHSQDRPGGKRAVNFEPIVTPADKKAH